MFITFSITVVNCCKMNKISILLLFTFAHLPNHHAYDFPALEKWTNKLESREDVELFVKSSSAFGREFVVIVQGEGPEYPMACLGTKNYPLIEALERIDKNRRDHQVFLIFKSRREYEGSLNALALKQHNWIWLYFPIEQGPNDDQKPVVLSDFTNEELQKMHPYQMAFGLTTDADFGKGEFLRRKMQDLCEKIDEWYTRLEYRTDFIVELSLNVLLNSSDSIQVLTPIKERTMMVSLVATNKYQKQIIKNKGILSALARLLTKERVFLNIPEDLKEKLNPTKWYPNSTSLGVTHDVVGYEEGVTWMLWLVLTYIGMTLWWWNKMNR